MNLSLPMGRTEAQYERIKRALPVQLGDMSRNLLVVNVVLRVARPFEAFARIRLEAVSLGSTSNKVLPDGTDALKKTASKHRQGSRRMEQQGSIWIWLPRSQIQFALSQNYFAAAKGLKSKVPSFPLTVSRTTRRTRSALDGICVWTRKVAVCEIITPGLTCAVIS